MLPPSTPPPDPRGQRFIELLETMERLLSPEGCPWDREQTLETLKPFLIEEAYEVLEAMDAADPREHCDELGDLMFQIVFQSALRQRAGAFDAGDVCAAIVEKLVRRHPHVFAGAQVSGTAEVLANWETIKAAERAGKAKEQKRTLSGIPRALPALARALRASEKAARVGFEWPDIAGARAKITEELAELDAAGAESDRAAMQDELGDLLFSIVNFARRQALDPEAALRATIDRFCDRFAYVEDRLEERGVTPAGSTLAEMDALWNDAKRALSRAPKK
jgi:MazG family protein